MRIGRTLSLLVFLAIVAGLVTFVGLAAFAGTHEAEQQFNRSFSAVESTVFIHAPWALRILAPSATSAEQEVWSFVLRELSSRGTLPLGVNTASLWPLLESQNATVLFARIAEGSAFDPGDSNYATAVHDFIFRNTRSVGIPSRELPPGIRPIPLSTLDAEDQGPNGWNTFTTRNAVKGYVTVSRVGFTPRGDRAILYVQLMCGPLCGHGAYYILAKEAGTWKIVTDHVTWVS